MPITLMYITNRPEVAKIAQKHGTDRIFVDLELLGKVERQGYLDTVISRHTLSDVQNMRKVVTTSKLLVRINPVHENTKEEIENVISAGADIIMLPYFKTVSEVKEFLSIVNRRVKTCLLFETAPAVENMNDILMLDGVDEVHIGLNDLHLEKKKTFMFELLSDGTVENMCRKFRERGLFYGFGGVARLGQGLLPAETIIAEHYRLGSQMAILSRSFCNIDYMSNLKEIDVLFSSELLKIRKYEQELLNKDAEFFLRNYEILKRTVKGIVDAKIKLKEAR